MCSPIPRAPRTTRSKDFPGGVAGKTGTADVQNKGPTSFFSGVMPIDNPQYAVVAVVEQGGHGAQIAAPIVRQVIEALYNQPATPIPTGNRTTPKD